ncbi:FUSC family protein [Actinomycetota bacterium Odt1-20B]
MTRPQPWKMLAAEAGAVARSARRAVTSTGSERTTTVQALKAAGAALIAWALAGWWWDAPMAILAPWTAVVLVHHTVYRSLRSAGQQFLVVAAGTLVAAAAAALTHDVMAAMAIAMPATVLIGAYGRFGDQGWYGPTAALFTLTYGSFTPPQILHRLAETLLGAVIGVLVNALVLPPVHTASARRLHGQVRADCAALLHDVADGIEHGYDETEAEDWHGRALRLGSTVSELRRARRHAHESRRLNPGRRMRRSPTAPPPADAVPWQRVADHLATILRSLAETARETPRFAAPTGRALATLAVLLRSAGQWCEATAEDVLSGRADDDFPDRPGRPDRPDAPHRPGPPSRSERALVEAQEAGRRLASLLDDPAHGPSAALGELTAATTRLLDDLQTATDGSGPPPGSRRADRLNPTR